MKRLTLLLCCVLLTSGCLTVTPDPVKPPTHISWDAGEANGGVIALTQKGAEITPRALERYEALIDIYGKHFVPSLKTGHGVTKTKVGIFLDNDALEKFIVMNQWRRMGKTP